MSACDINIYAVCRNQIGMTQEAWAEALGISVESVRRYESGKTSPSNYTVTQMIGVSGNESLAYKHLLATAHQLGVIPKVATDVPLTQAAIRLINRVLSFGEKHRDRQLLRIAEDGVVDETERPLYNEIVTELHEIVSASYPE